MLNFSERRSQNTTKISYKNLKKNTLSYDMIIWGKLIIIGSDCGSDIQDVFKSHTQLLHLLFSSLHLFAFLEKKKIGLFIQVVTSRA